MMSERFYSFLRCVTWAFLVSVAALIIGVFIILIPIEILQLTAAKGFEVGYFRLFGVVASVTLPGVAAHFIMWDLRNDKNRSSTWKG